MRFFRINALTIELPPLRERGADILVLAEHFLRRVGRAGQSFSANIYRQLLYAKLKEHDLDQDAEKHPPPRGGFAEGAVER